MNSKNDSLKAEDFSEETNEFDNGSIEEFFKELEAKEKALHISPEMVIEIDENDSDEEDLPTFLRKDFPGSDASVSKQIAPNPTVKNELISSLENKVSQLENQISKMRDERTELFENARRRTTDFDNFKKRTERERSETFRNQLGNLANQMLPVLDNLERALNAATNLQNEKALDFQQFYEGIVLVNQQLNEILAEMGIEPIASVGERFDPHFHEAVATEKTDEFSPHTIIEELLRGYRIGDKVIRPSVVKVSSPS